MGTRTCSKQRVNMLSTSQLFVIVTAIAAAHGATFNVTSGPDDYFLAAQRELLRDVELVELQITFTEARYADRLDVIKMQQQQVLDDIIQLNQTYTLQQSLSLVRKHCIQSYAPLLTTYDTAKLQFKTCNDYAEIAGSSLTLGARSTVNSARTHVNVQLPRNIADCNAYSKNQTRYEYCYIGIVEYATQRVQSYLTSARDILKRSKLDARVAVETNVKCSYFAEKLILGNISSITQSVAVCQSNLSQQGLGLPCATKSSPNLLIGNI